MRLHEPACYGCPFCRDRRAISRNPGVFRTDEVMVLEDPGQPVGDVGSRRATRIFACAGRLARGGRRLRLRLAAQWPWAADITTGFARIQALAPG